ncbi:hypothetical protein EVAR_97770_1 [Eumeta japonica]|uniref:Reverse transcriptase domain-containing protein n=1 Tax=Eumeta variegata TaxID=151549 RepID=A0A4C1Y6F1_EUMVA|nr:hypothetical protein EVAR_97770_1 [Eumeta japonica]
MHGMGSGLIQALQSLYRGSSACDRINTLTGLTSARVSDRAWVWTKDGRAVKCFLYADDQVILAPSTCGLQDIENKVNDSVKKRESWVWQKKNENRINVMEMRSLRNICGVSRKDTRRNSDVRERCGLKEDLVTK